MNKRIKTISTYIKEDDKVADIGCDQALLSEVLAKKGIYSVASDIKENIIENAKKRLKKLNFDNYINFIVSDGIKNIPDEIDTLVLAGMGTHTILSILDYSNKKYKKIITISNNHHEMLRKNMSEKGYKIFCEEIIIEKGKYYNLIIFEPGVEIYNKIDFLLGVNHKNQINLNKKLIYDLKKFEFNYKHSKDNVVLEKINIIKAHIK